MDHLTEQDAGLLEQAASMLEGLANDERNRGNCSSSEGAACSAHAIRRLAPALLRVGRGCLAQIEEPAAVAGPVLDVRAIAAAVCQRVAELPDRNSPEDWPEAMLVTGQELIDVVTCELEQAQAAPALEAPAHQCCNSWFASLPEGRQAVLRDDKWMLASAAYEAGREPCSALEAPAAARADLLVTVAMQVARGGNITSDIQTHDNSYADVATGLAEIKREIERVFREKYNCPHYPKSAQEAHIPIVRHAAAPQAPAAPSDAQLLSEWDRVSGITKATERRLACMRSVLQRWGSAAPAAPAVDAKAHDWRENASYGGEICAECGAAKGSRRGNAPCAWPPEPLDVRTDPYNCARCKAHPNHRKGLEHAGISRPRSAAQAKEGGAPVADAAPLDVCTDPYNCARCKTHPAHRGDMHHAGISRIGGSA